MSNNTSLVTDTAAMDLGSAEMLTLSPVVTKSTPTATLRNNDEAFTPPRRLNRPTLQHQHSYAGHEASFASDTGSNNNIARAPSGRPFLATRHISMEELGSNHRHPSNNREQQQQRTPPPAMFQSQWTLQPSYAINPHASYHPHQILPRNGFHGSSNNREVSHSFSIMHDHQSPAFSPMGGDDAPREQPPDSPRSNFGNDNHGNDDSMEEDNNHHEQGTPQQQQPHREESAEERAQREEDESLALAQMLMAEEAMASHRMSADFLRMNSDQFSAEDFEALQNALQEEDAEEEEVEGDEEDVEEMSYDALLQLGERIGDVKTDRWAMIAHKEIAKLETYEYDPEKLFYASKNDSNEDGATASSKCCEHKKRMEDIDDSEIKCLVCQFPYEKGDQLRKLPCGHCFHKDCVDQWLMTKDICAYCRQSICKSDDKDKKKEAGASGSNST